VSARAEFDRTVCGIKQKQQLSEWILNSMLQHQVLQNHMKHGKLRQAETIDSKLLCCSSSHSEA
jgi:hypothetical protein